MQWKDRERNVASSSNVTSQCYTADCWTPDVVMHRDITHNLDDPRNVEDQNTVFGNVERGMNRRKISSNNVPSMPKYDGSLRIQPPQRYRYNNTIPLRTSRHNSTNEERRYARRRFASRSISPTPSHESRRGHRREFDRKRRRRSRSRDRVRRRSRDRRSRSRSRDGRVRREHYSRNRNRSGFRNRSEDVRKHPLCPEFTEHMRCAFGNTCWYAHNHELARLVRLGRDNEMRVVDEEMETKTGVVDNQDEIDSEETVSEEEKITKHQAEDKIENETKKRDTPGSIHVEEVQENKRDEEVMFYEEVEFYEEYVRQMGLKIRHVTDTETWVSTRKQKWRALRRLHLYRKLHDDLLENKRICAESLQNETFFFKTWLSLRKTKWRLMCKENAILAEMKSEVEANPMSDDCIEEKKVEFDLAQQDINLDLESREQNVNLNENIQKENISTDKVSQKTPVDDVGIDRFAELETEYQRAGIKRRRRSSVSSCESVLEYENPPPWLLGVGVDSILSEKEEDFAKDRKDEKKEDPEVEKSPLHLGTAIFIRPREAESESIEISDDEEECHSPMRKRIKVIYDSDEEMTIGYIDEAAKKKKKKTTTTTTIKKRRRLRKVGRDSDSENMDRMYAVPETTAKEVNGESSSSSVIDLVSNSDEEEIFESRARKQSKTLKKSDEFVVIELKDDDISSSKTVESDSNLNIETMKKETTQKKSKKRKKYTYKDTIGGPWHCSRCKFSTTSKLTLTKHKRMCMKRRFCRGCNNSFYLDEYKDHLVHDTCPVKYSQERERAEEMKEIQDRLFKQAQKEMQMRMAQESQQQNSTPGVNEQWMQFWSQWNATTGDPFQCLGFTSRVGVTGKDLKARYRNLSKVVHPDKCKHELATSAFANISNAKRIAMEYIRECRV